MGYLFLFSALAFGFIKAYCGKKTSSAAVSAYSAILINTVRMVLCILIAILLILINRTTLLPSPEVILIALLCGIGTACFTVSWLLAAVYCMCTYKSKDKFSISLKALMLLLLCAVSSGLSDFSQKLYIKEIENADISVFNLYTYLFAAIILLIACCVIRAKEKTKPEIKAPRDIVKPIFHYIAIMAICLFLNAYFKTLAAKQLNAVLLYPLNQGCSVVLSLAMATLLFKEKINAKGIFGVALSVVAMILINVFGG